MDGAAAQLLGLVGQGQRQPPVDQAAEQQVKVGAVILDVGFQSGEHPLIVVIRRIVDVLHVGIVQFKNAEADIEVLRSHGAFGLNLVSGTADALFADFADRMDFTYAIKKLNSFFDRILGFCVRSSSYRFVQIFWQLYHNAFSMSTILCIQLHYSMCSCCAARKEIHNYSILVFFCGSFYAIKNSIQTFGECKGCAAK